MPKLLAAILFLLGSSLANGECLSSIELEVAPGYGLTFVGFEPSVSRFSGAGMGNKIVLKNYEVEPMVVFEDNKYVVSPGESCSPDETKSLDATTESAATILGGVALSIFSGSFFPTALTLALASAVLPMASADGPLCSNSVDVEIYTDVDDLIHQEYKSGQHEICPPETFYWKHHDMVHAGYEGCVGEKFMSPCPQDGQTYIDDSLLAMQPYTFDAESGECAKTEYDMSTSAFWILWGNPLDKYELIARTGLNPTVKFPFIRGTYPAYNHGSMSSSAADDSLDAKYKAFDVLVYIDAFQESERDNWAISMSEGAESGMITIYAAKALEIAQTTCNRDIYVLSEAPSYGYGNGDAEMVVNQFASSFYEGEECLCFATGTCKDGIVKIITVGFLPGDPLPVKLGGDNVTYVANSASVASPWFETMVYPENPTGAIKIPQLPNSNRRVCDGVYTWPMYFGFNDYVIPSESTPDCASWSFSITKIYSASVRAGFIMYKKEPAAHFNAVNSVVGKFYSMSNGLYSQWSWQGQMQIWDIIMSKPYSDPTSWIGAYSELMKEKWEIVEDGFKDCPVVELTNKDFGAYGFFLYKEPYLGIQDSMLSSFFMDVLGVKTTTYYWGFRGSNPTTYYGDGVGVYDFSRFHLYRDITIYEEVARRAKIVCGDTSAHIGDFVSIDDWAMKGRRSRRLNAEGELHDEETHRALMQDHLPHLTDRQLDVLVNNEVLSHKIHTKVEGCAPEYTTTCIFDAVGTRFEDDPLPEY